MNKLYRVLVFLVFFGLGVPCASAANTTSFIPQTVQMDMGSSQEVQIVMDEVPAGLAGFNVTISVSDPDIAEITAVSFPSWNSIPENSTVPSSSVLIKGVDLGEKVNPNDVNVSLGNITVTGKQAGTAGLNIQPELITADGGSTINSVINPGEINVLDTESPVINSVDLNDSKPKTGDSILVTVDTTDNVGVSSVKANDVSLVHQGGNIWNGSIVALEGTNYVNVSSADAAGNVAWNNSTSYKATGQDKVSPVINSISLNKSTPYTGDFILVTVDTTDNVEVNEVKANDVSLVHQSGNIWNGSITAVEGTHFVNVSSADAAGNVAWKNDTSYTATTPELPDTEFPVINSVSLNDNAPNTGDSILVTVDTTDNVGVSSVKANDVSLVHQSGNIWNGSITASEGTHSVNVSSEDAAGNIAWNNDTSYTATTPELPDTEFPVINSVSLNDNTPNTGDSILVTVDTTDNVGVSEVKANDVSLVHQSGNIWNGSITASEGTHFVNVSSADAAGNVAWKNDTSYTATTPELPDTEFPVINSVSLNNNTPNTGGSILVTVDTTDNVGVSSVKANDVSLVHQSGNIWNGSITASEGAHSVNVSSEDAAGHVAWNNDTSYTATTPGLPDTEFPVINSVSLNDNTPNTGGSILVTVDTTDNVEVSSVKANDVSFDSHSGNIWSGSIVAVEGTHSVNVSSEDAAGHVTWDNDTSYTATAPDPTNSEGELQLWAFDASKVSELPDNIYTANPINSTSNVSLAYNSTLGSIDSSCWYDDGGETYITGAYPAVNENLTFTMGVDSSSEWSYGYIHTSVAYVGVRHALDGSYWIKSYWTSDDGSQLNSSFQIPASSVVNNRVTVSIHSYDSNRTNVVTAGPGMSVTTPYTTETTRKLPYTNVIQPLIYLEFWADGADGWVNVHLYNITQSIPRDTITPYARNDIMAFGFDYPNVANNQNGTDLLISHNQTASVYVSEANLINSDDIDYDNSLFANGFKGCIHFHPGLASESLEEAENTVDTQTALMEEKLGLTPASWSSTENNDNVTHAIYAYNKYGSLYRNGPMGMDFIPNVNTLSNETWDWWSVSSEHGAISPCFTHETDNYPAVQYSIDPDLFKTFVLNLNSNGIDLVDFSKWYYSSMAQTAITDVLQSDENNLKFQLNTSGGYSVNINVQTMISPSSLDFDGVSVPFNQTSDGIQFMSVGNGTYTLKNSMPVLPVANFSTNVSEGFAPLIVQFTNLSENAESVAWDFENDGVIDTEESNPVHEFTTPGNYTVNLTANNTNGTNSKLGTITVTEKPESVLPVANFSTNVSEGFAPLVVQFTNLSENAESVAWDFESDGVIDTEESNPVHEFTTAGTYTVNLTANNTNGTNSKLSTITVTEKPESVLPVANFSTNVSEGYAPLIVQFTNLSKNAESVAWDFESDGVIDTEESNPVHEFTTAGTYTVNLTANNTNGTNSKLGIITVTEKPESVIPVANFTASLTVQFTDTSTNNPTQWEWNFGDGTNSTEQNPVHVYGSEGTYTVTLVATNDAGSSDNRSMVITVTRLIPVADFTANTTEGSAPLTVQFTDTSTNSPTQWNWDFGDGTNSTEQNPEHVFSGEGTYNVTLVTINGDGSSNPKSMNIKVNSVPTPSVASFTADPTEGSVPLTVQFTDTSTNSPTQWNWDFGDGTTSTEQNPEHVFSGEGTYSVTLVVTNGDGSSDPKSMNIKVNSVPTPPVVNFTAQQTGPLTVQFNDASSNSPTQWNWDFGDGSTSTDANPAHSYAAAGTYTVNLTVSNADGSDTTSKAITITGTSASPTASFTLAPQIGRSPLTVKFTDKSVNAASIKWDFGDGTTSTESNPSHTYTTGFYIVRLTATNGDKSSTAANIVIVGR